MHPSAKKLGSLFFKSYLSNVHGKKVVDIGAQNVNGSLRDVCPEGVEYIGVDFVAGDGVDVILDDPYKLPFEDTSVDVIVCSSVFEHSQFFWLLYLELMRILKPDGVLYLNAPSNGYIHRYPVDCWRFYPDAGAALVAWAEKNGYQPALLESFVAGKAEGTIDSDPASAWNDFVAVFVKDASHSSSYKQRILYGYSNYSNATCDNPLLDLKSRGFTEDFTLIKELGACVAEHEAAAVEYQAAAAKYEVELERTREVILDLESELARIKSDVVKSDGEIADLIRSLDEREESLLRENQVLAEMRQSTSWRVTKPLRWAGKYVAPVRKNVVRARHLLARVRNALRARGGIRGTLSNGIGLYRREGISGVARRVMGIARTLSGRGKDSTIDRSNIPVIQFETISEGFVEYKQNPSIHPDVKLIAFYLPQFHPFAENDQWWGKGFTEWSNVTKATPNYVGHYQPHLPIHSGYYDLRVPKVMEEQARLAKEYGIHGFNYYFYWFAGKILMDTPLEMMLNNPNVDMPFCLTWANENWTRRWDGQEHDVLIAQDHSAEDSLAFIQHLIKYFNDSRYIKIDGKPVLIIYRASIIPEMAETAVLWREEVVKHGFPGLYLICAQTFGIKDPEEFGFDAALEFPPHTTLSHLINEQLQVTNANYAGNIFSYEQVVGNVVRAAEPDYKLFRTAMLSWDNTARKQNNSHTFHGFSLLRYKQWLSFICNNAHSNPKYASDEKLVFVNAWNEWAEGTHLEPDRKYGYGYLQATYDVLSDYDQASTIVVAPETGKKNAIAAIIHVHYVDVFDELEPYLQNLQRVGCDFYFTVTSREAALRVRESYPDAAVLLVENRGRDVLPFIKVLSSIRSLGYEAICKLHGKKSSYRSDGNEIRNELVSALAGSTDKVLEAVGRFKTDPALGLLAPSKYLIEHTDWNMKYNHDDIAHASRLLGLEFVRGRFPAGSMFWLRPEALEGLEAILPAYFDIERGLSDGTLPHAIERLVGLLVEKTGYNVSSC
ncbi:glycoside hydrolase family 99-like domain-containing protein [Pseudomonas sp. RC3H12]|uniref:glycoside hydrolase family 99-like domain-containing protein n=1 Tax=Pseudomonas sp. RC3H12 TaxID=2834406 RepID=UPI001BDF14B3|nr:glycoside hydrolase family 99-like domain-containing protein [Pseudomonas sp. RC3H12]QWA29946.1 glycoside hydrolase family 99-like domain-containing protein [Pseudomonas sp. RC3H12]